MNTSLPVPKLADRRGRHAAHAPPGGSSPFLGCGEGGEGGDDSAEVSTLRVAQAAQQLEAAGLA